MPSGVRVLPKKGTPELERLISEYTSINDVNELADRYNISSSGLTNAMLRMGVRRNVIASPKVRYDNPPRIDGDVLITCDEQIPFHDAEFMNRVLDLAYAWGIPKGITAGDTLNGTAFSPFGFKPDDAIWKQEANIAHQCLVAMIDAVPDWLMLMGNHTSYINKRLSEQIGMNDLIKLLDNPVGLKGSDYYYCIVNGNWRISHPRNVSVLHGRVPSVLCDKYRMNVAAGHGHLVGIYPARDGQLLAIDIGICADPMRLDYYAQRDNTRPVMNQGALILKRDREGVCRPHLLSPLWTDWAAMKRMYKREV